MHVLAIDTSTDTVVAGIADIAAESGATESGGTEVIVRAERSVSDHRRHAEVLTTLIAECLDESRVARADLAAVVVGCGPGPFTGLRVGMATGAAFADALAIPAYPVCSLDAIVAQQLIGDTGPGAGSVVAVTDARRREIYWARYEDGRRVDGPHVDTPASVLAVLADRSVDVVVGSPTHSVLFERPIGSVTVPTVAGLVTVVRPELIEHRAPEPLTPLYLRRPDAVERAVPARAEVGR